MSHMEKKIKLKSDQNTLEEFHQGSINKIHEILRPKQKQRNKYLVIFFICILTSLLLIQLNPKFIILTYVSILVFLVLFVIDLSNRIKVFFMLKKYNSNFKEFKEKYEGCDIVTYSLSDDKLIYTGHEVYEYNWTDFTSLQEYYNSFLLNHPNEEMKIMIPKTVLVNKDDYEFFKDYATARIVNPVD